MKIRKFITMVGSLMIMGQLPHTLNASMVTLTGAQAESGGAQACCLAQSVSASVVPDETPPPPTACCSSWTYDHTDYNWTDASGNSATASVFTTIPGDNSVGVTMTHHWNCSTSGATTTTTETATPVYLNVDDVTIAGPNIVGVGQIITLASNSPSGSTLTWTPSNSDASVAGGVVTGISPGICTITVSDGMCSAAYDVTVTTVPPSPITLTSDKSYIQVDQTPSDSATFSATGGSGNYTYNSSLTNVATIGASTGVASPLAIGTTLITATDNNTHAVSNAIKTTVYKITTKTKWTAPANHDSTRKKLGVGELVHVSAAPASATWAVTTGTGIVTPPSGPDATFNAPNSAETDVLQVTLPDGSVTNVTFTIIEPKTETATKQQGIGYLDGVQGAGMILRPITVGPADVSFHGVEMREIGGPASNIQGCFGNGTYPGTDLNHYANLSWIVLNANNNWADQADFGGYPPVGNPPIWHFGAYTWDIPIEWEVSGTTDLNTTGMPHRTQVMTIWDATGKSEVDKLLQKEVRTP